MGILSKDRIVAVPGYSRWWNIPAALLMAGLLLANGVMETAGAQTMTEIIDGRLIGPGVGVRPMA